MITETAFTELFFPEFVPATRDSQFDTIAYFEDFYPSASTPVDGGFDGLFGLDPFSISGMSPVPFSSSTCSLIDASIAAVDDVFGSPVIPKVNGPKALVSSTKDTSSVRTIPTRTTPSPAAVTKSSDPVARKRERNRVAAARCRERRMTLIDTLQKECDDLKAERERLLAENDRLLRALGLQI